ncbi:MAG: TonB-dependent receptor [Phascolarctobacterium sp.]|nr:TonB-dependent receptor [Phascolarctobacterium sp.]
MKKMSKGMLMTALICGAVYLGGSPVYASELQEFSLDEYVVTAARTETKLVDTPANISVVDAQTIEERHYQDVSEVLKDVPGATIMDDGVGANEKVLKLNGDERVLVLIDGRRVNSDMGLTNSARASLDMNQLPDVDLIERIEVLKGAGGALYGSDAVGGVVNIITKKTDKNYGKVSLGFGSNDKRDMSAMYSFKEGKTGLIVAAVKDKQGYYKFKDISDNRTKRRDGNSNFENEKFSLKLVQEITDDTELTIGYDFSNYEGRNPGAVTSGMSYWGIQDKESQNMYAKFDWGLANRDIGYIQVYHHKLDYSNLYNNWDGTTSTAYLKEDTTGIDVQQEISISDNNKIVIGASYRDTDAENPDSYATGKNIDNLAFFLNDTWNFAPTWTLNAGVRYDDHSQAGDETTMSAGINKKFDEESHIYFNWSQVFKAPNIDDLFTFIPAGTMGGSATYGDPNLKPETGDVWTLGYNTKISDNTVLGINYFESNLKDAIDWVYDPNYVDPTRVRNVDEQKKKGMEFTVNHKLNNNVDFIASYTYLKVENNDEGKGFVRDWNVMPNVYRLGVKYKDGKWDTNIWLRAGNGGATHKYDKFSTLDGQSYVDSSYWTLDATITYKATKDLSFYAKGYNLFNESYADFAGVNSSGSYSYPAQSRRFIVGAEYKF